MKIIFYSFISTMISLSTLSTNAQNIFLGTWEHQNGNEVFRIVLWEDPLDNNSIKGHYKMVQIENGLETIIYSSNKNEHIGINEAKLPFVIYGSANNQTLIGLFYDNTIDSNQYHFLKKGSLHLEILTNSGGLNPTITAHWKVERKSYQGLIINEAPEFSVPTDIILTKIN